MPSAPYAAVVFRNPLPGDPPKPRSSPTFTDLWVQSSSWVIDAHKINHPGSVEIMNDCQALITVDVAYQTGIITTTAGAEDRICHNGIITYISLECVCQPN